MTYIQHKVKIITIITLLWLVLGARPAFATNSGPFSAEVWVNPTTSIASKAILGKSEELRIFTDASGYAGCQIKVTTWQTAATATTNALALNTWSHVACAYDKVNLKIYVNGVQMASQALTSSPDDTANVFRIGQDDSASTPYANLTGTVDDFKFYNYARTPAQIQEDLQAGRQKQAVGYWKFDEGQGTAANNSGSAGSALNGTITSGAWSNSGKFGKAITFTASTSVTKTLATDPAYSNTLSLWVYPTTSAASKTLITATKLTTDSSSRPVYGGCTGTTLSLSTWTHIVAVSDGSGICKIYQNGVQTTSSTTGVTFGTSLNIGGSSFVGSIDEVKLYHYALTADEIKLDYNRGSTLVLGSLGDNSNYQKQAANQEYCVPGDSTSCAAPVLEWKMDEKTGISANDTSGNGNTGTLTAGPTWTRGKIGSAVEFDGTNDYVVSTNNVGISGDVSFTIEGWFYFRESGVAGGVAGWGNIETALQAAGIWYSYRGTNVLSVEFAGSNGAWVDVPTSPNTWHHIAVTKIPGAIETTTKIYVNGKDLGAMHTSSSDSTPNITNTTFNIGRWANYPDYVNALIDQVRLYNYVRTPAQVAYDYNRGGPVAWYKFDECTGATANDASGNGNTGTITVGASGSQTSTGTCGTSTTTEAWNNGTTGKRNASIKLDGNDDYVTTAAFSPLATAAQTTTKASWGGWFYPTSTASLTLMEKATEFRLTTDANSKPVCGISSATLATNLISYWKLDEASGSRVDEVGGNTLADNNTVTGNPGKLGNAAQFTAANSEYLSIADNDSVSVTDQDFMFAAWVYLDSKPGNYQIILSKRGTGYPMGDDYWLGWSNTADQFTFAVWSGASPSTLVGSVNATSFGSPSLATWYYVVAWHDSVANTVNISVNNGTTDSAATSAVPSNGATGPFMLGLHGGSTTRYWDGRIDSVGFWKRVLTSAERTDLYNGGVGLEATAAFHDAVVGSTALTTSAWNHVMCTYDGANIKTYLNGSLVGTTAETNNVTAASSILYMGENSSGAQRVTGQLDDVRVYNYALTASQIKTLMNEGAARFGPSTGSP